MAPKHWLMKAEPDSRVVKGKDVKFSVDDFEACGTTPWEGVRNFEARNLMKEMAVGDKVLFYHSNCKNPGIAAFAEVSKEAYPDYTAWDASHPYFDAKTDKENPKWYMVEVTFASRAKHFVSLALLKRIAASSDVPEEVAYIGDKGAKVIKEMALLNRGRLSVQRVEKETWDVVNELAEKGGWEEPAGAGSKPKGKGTAKAKGTGGKGRTGGRKASKKADHEAAEGSEEDKAEYEEDAQISNSKPSTGKTAGRKRKAVDQDAGELRRSTRRR